MRGRNLRRWGVLLTACMTMTAIAAVTIVSPGAAKPPKAKTAAASVADLKKKIASYTKPPARIYPSLKITKAIPKGKRLVFVNCGAPACTNMGAAFKQAAAVLGWKVTELQAAPTPPEIQKAFDEAIRLKPDGVVSTGFGSELYPQQLAKLKAMKIPVFSGTGTDPTGKKGIALEPLPPSKVFEATRLLADKTIVDIGGKGKVGAVVLTGYPIVKLYTEAYVNEIKRNCPQCSVVQISVQPTDIGTTAASKIASFLQANPGVKGLFISYEGLGAGLKAAVQGAGVSYPKTYSWAPDAPGVRYLQSGERTASVPLCYPDIAWQWVDGFARLFTGGTIKPDNGFERFVIWSKDYNNVPKQTNNPPCIANYKSQFKALWNK